MEAFACAAIPSVFVSFAILVTGLLALVGVYGMWKEQRWGWWVLLFVDTVTTCGSIYLTVRDFRYLSSGQVALGVALATIPLVLLLFSRMFDFDWD
jgi:protein-S-isoprenylcysteine O-methyltransferase Ste14